MMVARSAINYNNFTDTPAASSIDQSSSIKWIHVADASLRIEAIISGQAIAAGGGEPIIMPTTTDMILQPTQTTMVQPPDTQNSRKGGRVAATEAFIIPIPHTVVVIRQETASSPFRPEPNESKDNRRIGILSQQFLRLTRRSISLSPPRGRLESYHDCCPTLRVLTECCGLAPHPVGHPVMC